MKRVSIVIIIVALVVLASFARVYMYWRLIYPQVGDDTDEEPKAYYVSNDGVDSNSGTSISSPWKTIGKVNTELDGGVVNAGDDIYFNRGDTWTGGEYLNLATGGESSSNRMIIGAYGTGDIPELNGADEWSYGIFINNKHNIIIENLKIQSADIWIRIEETCSYITVQNCNLLHSNGSWGGIYVYNHCRYIKVLNNYIYNSLGDVVEFHTDVTYSIIEGNTIIGGPSNNHACVVIRTNSSYNIVRNNTIYDGDDDLVIVLYGTKYCLFENNIMNSTNGAGIKFQGGSNHIIRNNRISDCREYGMGMYTNSVTRSAIQNNKFYHNTVYDCGDGTSMDANNMLVIYSNGKQIKNNIMKNNIFYRGDRQVIYASAVAEYESYLHDNFWDNNIIFDSSVDEDVINYQGSKYNVSEAESSLSEEFEDNIQLNPQLVDPDNGDFDLQSDSPAIDAGGWLTTTNGGGTGTTLTVHDAGYFCDGFGLIDGDDIMVGSNKVTVVDVDYVANIITVDSLISWNDGEPVSLTYIGSAPDIGISGSLPFDDL